MAHSLYIGWLLNSELIAKQVEILEEAQSALSRMQLRHSNDAAKSALRQELERVLDMALFKIHAYIKNQGTLNGIQGQRGLLGQIVQRLLPMAENARSCQFMLEQASLALRAIDVVVAEIQRHEKAKPW